MITERVDDELLVYDEVSQIAHCLSAAAVPVWERCNGQLSPAEIADGLGRPLVAVEQALDELRERALLDDGPLLEPGYSRRQAVTRIAKIGGAAFTAPLIYSVAVGSTAAAASACLADGSVETGCTAAVGAKAADARCCSGTCYQNGSNVKKCVATSCNLPGLGCLISGASCCSGGCVLAFCTT